MPADVLTIKRVEDRVIARAKNRKRPMMPDDETVIRVICAGYVENYFDRDDWDEDDVVELLVACVGGVEFEVGKDGGWRLRLQAPDAGMYPDDPTPTSTPEGEYARNQREAVEHIQTLPPSERSAVANRPGQTPPSTPSTESECPECLHPVEDPNSCAFCANDHGPASTHES